MSNDNTSQNKNQYGIFSHKKNSKLKLSPHSGDKFKRSTILNANLHYAETEFCNSREKIFNEKKGTLFGKKLKGRNPRIRSSPKFCVAKKPPKQKNRADLFLRGLQIFEAFQFQGFEF